MRLAKMNSFPFNERNRHVNMTIFQDLTRIKWFFLLKLYFLFLLPFLSFVNQLRKLTSVWSFSLSEHF